MPSPLISLFLFFFGGSGGYSGFCFGLPLSYIWKFIRFEVDFGSKSITLESDLLLLYRDGIRTSKFGRLNAVDMY